MALRRPKPPGTSLGRALEAGFESAIAIVLGVALGVYLDDRFGTGPWLLFLFTALGFATSVRRLLSIRVPPSPGDPPRPGSPR